MALANIGTVYLVGYAIGQFSSAYFGRKLGPRLLLLCGMAISIVCNMVFGASHGIIYLALFMAINGIAQGTGWPGCIGSLGFWFKRKERGSILGVWSTCYQVGPLVAGVWASFLLGFMGWRWAFFGASLSLMAIWAVVFFLHPNTPEDVGFKSVEDEADKQAAGKTAEAPMTQVQDGLGWDRDVIISVVIMGLIYFCIKFLRYALWSWAPYFLNHNFGMAGDQAGYLSTIFDLCGFAGVLASGWVSDKWFAGRRSSLAFLLLMGMTLSFIGMRVFGSMSITLFAVFMGCCGFMLYGPDSLLSGVGAIDVGSARTALVAAGIINGMGSIGPIFQEQIIGWMYEAFGRQLTPIFAMFVVVASMGAAATFFLYMRTRRGHSNV